MYELGSIILVKAVTPLHIGVGRSIGVVDMPIQRDGFGFPCIPSSSIKGALRAFFRERIGDCTEVLFGASPEDTESYAGAFTINEAYLLAIPARSLRGVWVLVTSPFLLSRFEEGLELIGVEEPLKRELEENMTCIKRIVREQILMVAPENYSIDDIIILNEEFRLKPQPSEELKKLAKIIYPEDAERFALVHDDLIKDIVERSILRRTRIKLERGVKRVETGGLWTEEEVPINTIFFTWFLYSRSRRRIEDEWKKEWEKHSGVREYVQIEGYNYATSRAVMECVESRLLKEGKGIIIFGGHETIGRGIVQLRKIGESSCH